MKNHFFNLLSLTNPVRQPKRFIEKIPLFQCHRGYWIKGKKENTLDSLVAAKINNYKMVEFDIQLLADGELVLFHDDVSHLNFDELIKKQKRVSKLSEVLANLDRLPGLLNIEIKTRKMDSRELVSALGDCLKKYKCKSKVLISSFNPFCLYQVQKHLPQVPVALLASEEINSSYPWYLRRHLFTPLLRPAILHLDHRFLDKEKVHFLLEKKFFIAAWTVNNSKRADELFSWGVGSIITDKLN